MMIRIYYDQSDLEQKSLPSVFVPRGPWSSPTTQTPQTLYSIQFSWFSKIHLPRLQMKNH